MPSAPQTSADQATDAAQPPHIAEARLLFYAVNGLGLGHVTRLLAIARAVRSLAPDSQILFLTTSEADWVIYREGFAAVKIPSRSILATAKLRPAVYTKLVSIGGDECRIGIQPRDPDCGHFSGRRKPGTADHPCLGDAPRLCIPCPKTRKGQRSIFPKCTREVRPLYRPT